MWWLIPRRNQHHCISSPYWVLLNDRGRFCKPGAVSPREHCALPSESNDYGTRFFHVNVTRRYLCHNTDIGSCFAYNPHKIRSNSHPAQFSCLSLTDFSADESHHTTFFTQCNQSWRNIITFSHTIHTRFRGVRHLVEWNVGYCEFKVNCRIWCKCIDHPGWEPLYLY